MKSANRVAFNTAILYGRMLITMGISLFSTRIILNALGSTDFGIFNLIAGIITMLSFLNSAMSTSTQRFLSFFQGQDNIKKQKSVFTNSLVLHITIGLILVFALEIIGLFLFDGFLNIPDNRIYASKIIYHFMSLTVFFTVISVPFTGTLVAHENMIWVAIVAIVETFLKLGIALSLLIISNDKLIVFGFLTACVSIVSCILYASFCIKKYDECTLDRLFVVDKSLLKELSSFAGWNLFGSLCGIGRNQGTAVILNIFFGAVVNAAYGIANQVSNQLMFFSSTMLRALNPQIMKSEGNGDRERMLRLSMTASKFGFFLLAILAIPCIFEMEQILKFWLNNIPEHTVLFCQLFLVATLINQLTIGLQSAIQATGNIKYYQVIVGSILLLNLPVVYITLSMGQPPEIAIAVFSLIELIACCFRLFFLKKIAGLSIKDYISTVFIKEVIPVTLSIIVCFFLVIYLENEYRFLFTLFSSMTIFTLGVYFGGLEVKEKKYINGLVIKSLTIFRSIVYKS